MATRSDLDRLLDDDEVESLRFALMAACEHGSRAGRMSFNAMAHAALELPGDAEVDWRRLTVGQGRTLIRWARIHGQA